MLKQRVSSKKSEGFERVGFNKNVKIQFNFLIELKVF